MSATPPPSKSGSVALEFIKKLGTIVAASLGVVLVAALALGQFHAFGLSNLLFWASLVVLGLAIVPAVAELGSGFTSLGKSLANKEGGLGTVLSEKHERRDKWLSASVLYGTAGIVLFVLSFLFATLVAPR
jgi:hypothetical protein